jgi:hypothetical protein
MDALAAAARLRGVQLAAISMELLDEAQERVLQAINITDGNMTATLAPTFQPTTLAPTLASPVDADRKKENNDAIITSVSALYGWWGLFTTNLRSPVLDKHFR